MKNLRKNQKRKRGVVVPSPLVGPSLLAKAPSGQIDVFGPVSISDRKNCIVKVLGESFVRVVVVPQDSSKVVFNSPFYVLIHIPGKLKIFKPFVNLEFVQRERDSWGIGFFHQLDSDFLERKSGDDIGVVFDFPREAHMCHLILRRRAFFVLSTNSADEQEESARQIVPTRLSNDNFLFFHEHLPQLMRCFVKSFDLNKRIFVIATAPNQTHQSQNRQNDCLFHHLYLLSRYCLTASSHHDLICYHHSTVIGIWCQGHGPEF